MKKNIINHFYENIFQLTTDPLYVYPEVPTVETPTEQPPEGTQKNINKKKNSYTTLFSALNNAEPNAVIKVENGLCA